MTHYRIILNTLQHKMAQVTKTPVMVLQELSVKRGVPPPVYELVPELTKQGTHKNEFYYEVSAFADVAYGSGSSKQIAKHDAARNMLNQLQACGLYRPSENPVQGFVPGFATLDNKPIKTSVNCIGTLCDLCEENKIPQPRFEEVSDVGPPHCRQFTYDCIVSSVRTRAMASTKKQAKQLAAEQMLERLYFSFLSVHGICFTEFVVGWRLCCPNYRKSVSLMPGRSVTRMKRLVAYILNCQPYN